MKKYYYVYYSYEEYGRGYIGKRECECLPEEDIRYFGSFRDKTFKPTQKIILGQFDSIEEALQGECDLHDFYQIDKNPHFANKARQTSKKFFYIVPIERAREIGKKNYELGLGVHALTEEQRRENGKKAYKLGLGALTAEQRRENGKKFYELGLGVHALTTEQRREIGKKNYELGLGVHGLTTEQRREIGKKNYELGLGVHALTVEQKGENGKKAYKLGLGIHALTTEQRRENGKKNYELGLGIHALTTEQRRENCKKGGLVGGKIAAARKYICLETGFIANAGNLAKYQRKRGIDTNKRRRIE